MKRMVIACMVAIMTMGTFIAGAQAKADFPSKPIHVMVYTAPGGLIDITARKMVQIAAKYTNATMVVENKPGAGGLVAWEYVLSQPADGYTLFAVTRSNIANLVSTESDMDAFTLDWMALLVSDPEALMVSTKSKFKTIQDVIADAKARPGKQIWIAPPGIDEFVTYKFWEKAGISGKFVPFDSGAQAMAAVIGGQGDVYVGNPADISGKPDLKMVAIAGEKRLKQFPDVPTLKESGVPDMENETMWRGFAVKKGTPAAIVKWYDDLFEKITNDPEWKAFFEKDGMELVHYRADKFGAMIRNDLQDMKRLLKK
jgi:tripartite-type tricarboxylate transporter receptor subunit TctC